MDATLRHSQRADAVARAVADIRGIEQQHGVTRDSLARIRDRLLALAAQRELFPLDDFPLPRPGSTRNNALYRLSEDADHRFSLYAHITGGGVDTPAHDHTTWAVIVGVEGDELNRLYDHDGQGGIVQRDTFTVSGGTGITFLPQDLHSIHLAPGRKVLNFHMYGLGLEQLHGRRYYRAATHDWAHFPASEAIRDLPMPA